MILLYCIVIQFPVKPSTFSLFLINIIIRAFHTLIT